MGPTIEHLVPIRDILATARDDEHALAMACDTSTWGIAHRRCQDQQGAGVTNGRAEPLAPAIYMPSIDW